MESSLTLICSRRTQAIPLNFTCRCQATSLLPSLPRSHFLSGEDSLMTPPHPGYAVQKPAVGRREVDNGLSGAPARRMIAVSSIAAVTVGFAAWAYATTKSQPQPEFAIVNATSLPPQAVVSASHLQSKPRPSCSVFALAPVCIASAAPI